MSLCHQLYSRSGDEGNQIRALCFLQVLTQAEFTLRLAVDVFLLDGIIWLLNQRHCFENSPHFTVFVVSCRVSRIPKKKKAWAGLHTCSWYNPNICLWQLWKTGVELLGEQQHTHTHIYMLFQWFYISCWWMENWPWCLGVCLLDVLRHCGSFAPIVSSFMD